MWSELVLWLNSEGAEIDPDDMLVELRDVPGAGRGLFVTRDLEPSTSLFTLPADVLLNALTLAAKDIPGGGRIETSKLTSTQITTLHLFLKYYEPSDRFNPYIASLPDKFDGHPLTWKIHSESKVCGGVDKNVYILLLSLLPHSVERQLKDMKKRFWGDWNALQELSVPRIEGKESPGLKTFLWAWLNVNTRCISFPISSTPDRENDLTLCPVIDLANHTADPQKSCALALLSSPTELGEHGDIIKFIEVESPPSPMKKGDQLYLRYGPHSNATLFAEYGFVLSKFTCADGTGGDDPDVHQNYGQVVLDDIIEDMFETSGRSWMKEMLQEWNYWGDWCIYSHPQPAHPSYRLFPALRLYHLPPSSHPATPSEIRAILFGEENDQRVKLSILDICDTVIARARDAIEHVNACFDEGTSGEGWELYSVQCIKQLWEEEYGVARGVKDSLENGVEF
ncbi:hypothetical protein BOTBODRAFT_33134 [Botryobasidium botryosum FD-172 SS1]|uniref:SET domain-containing protein n=1 Tax=Botryobasidium botryosum (strain FD-172 SS1) TaxID=930990 RepID=A0A067MEP4_BOTB1|nr:hypothetical protein BOTBODRAFT_33134 [Botryobasidium botryosum FD-172 SS1]